MPDLKFIVSVKLTGNRPVDNLSHRCSLLRSAYSERLRSMPGGCGRLRRLLLQLRRPLRWA